MKLIQIGTIVRTHGVKGAFVVHTDSGKESSLGTLKRVFLSDDPADPHAISEAAWMPSGWKLALEKVDTIEQAQALKGKPLYAAREELPPPREGEYYACDLADCSAVEEKSGKWIGSFEQIESGGDTSCWRFKIGTKSVLIPASKHFIASVDIKNKKIFLKNLFELDIP